MVSMMYTPASELPDLRMGLVSRQDPQAAATRQEVGGRSEEKPLHRIGGDRFCDDPRSPTSGATTLESESSRFYCDAFQVAYAAPWFAWRLGACTWLISTTHDTTTSCDAECTRAASE